jgi:hypothetical protein
MTEPSASDTSDDRGLMPAESHGSRRPFDTPLVILSIVTFAVYYLSNPNPHSPYDYTFRIAGAFLDGELGLTETPPHWLNEMVPSEGRYYSVFPLGSVISMLPVAALEKVGIISMFPGPAVAAAVAALIAFLLWKIAQSYQISRTQRAASVLFILFGTWMWCNLAFAGAWQIALGLAVLGQLGALHFTLQTAKPLLAGACFALAFGNRTETLLLAPVFFYLVAGGHRGVYSGLQSTLCQIARFCVVPFVLGTATLLYNHLRFHSPFDFGYARIPGVLEEPWYEHGIFSVHAISLNFEQMLIQPWRVLEGYPYYVPTGFGGSILLSSPFLLCILRHAGPKGELMRLAWISITLLTAVLWLHGNPGGWQFSYRYAVILLPWIFLLLLEGGVNRLTVFERFAFAFSILASGWGTYLFHWTPYVRP